MDPEIRQIVDKFAGRTPHRIPRHPKPRSSYQTRLIQIERVIIRLAQKDGYGFQTPLLVVMICWLLRLTIWLLRKI